MKKHTKKIAIGMFSLFGITAAGTAVLSTLPQTAVASAPMPRDWRSWFNRFFDALLELAIDWAKYNIQHGNWIVAPGPGTGSGTHTTDLNLTSLLNAPDMIADFSDNGISLSSTQLYLGGDLVLQNDQEMVVVLKKGTYAISQDGNAKVVLDIFRPSPTFPDPAGTLKF